MHHSIQYIFFISTNPKWRFTHDEASGFPEPLVVPNLGFLLYRLPLVFSIDTAFSLIAPHLTSIEGRSTGGSGLCSTGNACEWHEKTSNLDIVLIGSSRKFFFFSYTPTHSIYMLFLSTQFLYTIRWKHHQWLGRTGKKAPCAL